jgi:hypothetical protein
MGLLRSKATEEDMVEVDSTLGSKVRKGDSGKLVFRLWIFRFCFFC